jgi:hypothetical protein
MNDNNISVEKKPFHRKIAGLINRFLFAVSRKHNRNDFKVAMLLPDKKGPAVFSKVDQALNLISEFDSRRYLQIRRDVKKIWVSVAQPAVGKWLNELQTCVLDRNYFCQDKISASRMALTIVHEATHARLCKLKIKYTEDIRERVERICIKSEIAFAKRLPDGQKLVEMAESKLKRSKSFYTDAQHQQRNLDALAELRKKNWLARILYPIVKHKADKRNARSLLHKKD